GLPARMNLRLVEPLREVFKVELRKVGSELGLSDEILLRHPFPGPGLAVRILGEVTEERLAILRQADDLFISELQQTPGARGRRLYDETAQAFAVLLPVKSVGVMGDGRTYESVLALRAVTTEDFMTADWARLPDEFLARVSATIVNTVRGVNRVVYDSRSEPASRSAWARNVPRCWFACRSHAARLREEAVLPPAAARQHPGGVPESHATLHRRVPRGLLLPPADRQGDPGAARLGAHRHVDLPRRRDPS